MKTLEQSPTSDNILYPISSSHKGAALLIDVLVAVAIFGILFSAILTSLQRVAAAQIELKSRLAALFLMQSQFEKAESVSYDSVGVVSGSPAGIFAASEQVTENNTVFTRTTAVGYIDDTHDGVGVSDSNGKPHDYKQMTVTIDWSIKGKVKSMTSSRYYSAPGLEP